MDIPLLNCTKLFKFRCPRTWDSLDETEEDNVRFCNSCQKNVHLCTTPEDIKRYTGTCIAIHLDADGNMAAQPHDDGDMAQPQTTSGSSNTRRFRYTTLGDIANDVPPAPKSKRK
jgi:hypothetical protein